MKLTRQLWSLGLLVLCVSSFVYAQPAKKSLTAATTTNKPIVVKSSQPLFTITIPANLTTGYQWLLTDYSSDLVVPISRRYVPPKNAVPGAGGEEIWEFKLKPQAFVVPQLTHITLTYARPWDLAVDRQSTYAIVSVDAR